MGGDLGVPGADGKDGVPGSDGRDGDPGSRGKYLVQQTISFKTINSMNDLCLYASP